MGQIEVDFNKDFTDPKDWQADNNFGVRRFIFLFISLGRIRMLNHGIIMPQPQIFRIIHIPGEFNYI